MSYTPAYSLGGTSVPGWPAVAGNVAAAVGRPISILGADATAPVQPVMIVVYSGTTGQAAVVILECNGGTPDSFGNPPSTDWVDVSSGGYGLTIGASNASQFLGKLLPATVPFWRTRITTLTGGQVVSYVPLIPTPGGQLVSPSYPNLRAAQSLY